MAAERTHITELATAVGMVLGDAHWDLEMLAAVELPGIDESTWRPILEPIAVDWHQYNPILRASLANGAAFRRHVLKGRDPERIDWSGANRTMWVSDAPADLRVNEVLYVSAKYDSKCLLNRAPGTLFDALLNTATTRRADNWYATVAPDEYQHFYDTLVGVLANDDPEVSYLPADVTVLTRGQGAALKRGTKGWRGDLPEDTRTAYRALAHRVATESARRWRHALDGASDPARMAMLAQMIRVCGTTYWLLGQSSHHPVRCKVVDTSTWRQHYRLGPFDVTERLDVGQPQVDWRAVLHPRPNAPAGIVAEGDRVIAGYCEIRWSHGKFQGNPECKVQLRTRVADLPGYTPLETSRLAS